MQDVSIVGIGMTPVAEHWDLGLRELSQQAIQNALADAGIHLEDVDALVVGNALGTYINNQSHVAALVADYAGLHGVEAFRVEAMDASGGMALRQGSQLVASGAAEIVLVVGVESVTEVVGAARHNALATALDAEFEAAHGATPVAMAGLMMRRYMYEYGVELSQFEGFSINAHLNGSKNPNAMYRNKIKPGAFAAAPALADPVTLFDSAPDADGACALVLARTERAKDMIPVPVHIKSSAAATDTLAVHSREEMLFLRAANIAAGRAYRQAGVAPHDIHLLELHDAYTILSALQLEAIGFAERGQGWHLAADNKIGLTGELPLCTFGGLKARGNPLGATGVYQAAEITLQLRGAAGENQVANARLGMALNLGGLGASAVAHILERVD
ncbi:MAG: thiolase domain-containing protein [Anaerolineae bacterium]|nr:thiolase domain-containing protein [Anaerolineae bacterium]